MTESKKSFHPIRFINHYFGWRNWAVLVYNSVPENMYVMFFIALRQELYSIKFVGDFFVFLLFSFFCTTYGYLVNDLGDKELDKIHGKENTFSNDSSTKAGIIVLSFLFVSILLSLQFIRSPFFLFSWLLWFIVATAYSLKPIRLKEKGHAGLLLVVVAQRFLPTLLMFFAFQHYKWLDVIYFTIYVFFRGLSSDLNHQLEDYHKDVSTKTKTYAVEAGLQKTQRFFRLSLEIEKIMLLFGLLIMLVELKHMQIYNIPVMLFIFIFYLLIYGLQWIKILTSKEIADINPYVSNRRDIYQFIHHAFPSVVLPLFLILLLLMQNWIFLIILLFIICYRKLYSPELILNSYPVKKILLGIRRWR